MVCDHLWSSGTALWCYRNFRWYCPLCPSGRNAFWIDSNYLLEKKEKTLLKLYSLYHVFSTISLSVQPIQLETTLENLFFNEFRFNKNNSDQYCRLSPIYCFLLQIYRKIFILIFIQIVPLCFRIFF